VKVEREIDIAAPARELYEVIMDPQRLADWVTIHNALEQAPSGSLQQGSKLTQCLKLAGRPFRVHWTVVQNEPCRRVVWAGKGPVRSKASVTYEFEEDGGVTHFSYSNEYKLPGGPLGGMAGSVLKRVTAGELETSLQKLKQLVES
jgi:uncharacterized membrane protein